MNIEFIIISVIVVLASISIALGIINLLKLSFTSSQISNLEVAVEKKTKEFDTLKKERQSSLSHPAVALSGKPESSISPIQPPFAAESSTGPPIEIVRSSPTGFKTVAVKGMNGPGELDAVDKHEQGDEPHSRSSKAMEIVLFSDMKKDTDFNAAWQKLTSYLSESTHPQVIINLKNVLFLYEKELIYLEKMHETIVKAQGSIKFTNYHKELVSVISGRPTLAELLRE
jgi:hypothetical protein